MADVSAERDADDHKASVPSGQDGSVSGQRADVDDSTLDGDDTADAVDDAAGDATRTAQDDEIEGSARADGADGAANAANASNGIGQQVSTYAREHRGEGIADHVHSLQDQRERTDDGDRQRTRDGDSERTRDGAERGGGKRDR